MIWKSIQKVVKNRSFIQNFDDVKCFEDDVFLREAKIRFTNGNSNSVLFFTF